MTVVEICLDDLAGVRVAEEAGADRVELCAALSEGGITPSVGTVAGALRAATRIGIQVLIRQRPGDFVYDEDELQAMVDDIHSLRVLPHSPDVTLGFVVGALRLDGRIDVDATRRLVAACGDAPVTFHKAFDQVPDRAEALERLVTLGVARVLTSGGAATATEGAEALASLVAQAGDRIAVLAGGGVRPGNVAELVSRTGVREVHLRAQEPVATVAAGAPTAYDAGTREVTSASVVRAVVEAVGGVATAGGDADAIEAVADAIEAVADAIEAVADTVGGGEELADAGEGAA